MKPVFLRPTDEVKIVGTAFDTPIVVKGSTWFPLVEVVVWGIMAWFAGKRRPERSTFERISIGAITMPIVIGSEWCHNLAHAAAAKLVDKPMDALRITWGTPLVVYYDVEDQSVTPRQHIIRALGGPIFNASAATFGRLIRRQTHPESFAREVMDVTVGINTILCTVGLLPLPGIDGGPILKWSLVSQGKTAEEADLVVRKVDGVLAGGLGVAAAVAFKKRRWFIGGVIAQFALLALGFALGLIREK
jgi:hypothetical protein